MKLRAKSNGEIIEASLEAPEGPNPGRAPRICVGTLTLSLGVALITYDVVEATAEARRTLDRLGQPFGGEQGRGRIALASADDGVAAGEWPTDSPCDEPQPLHD